MASGQLLEQTIIFFQEARRRPRRGRTGSRRSSTFASMRMNFLPVSGMNCHMPTAPTTERARTLKDDSTNGKYAKLTGSPSARKYFFHFRHITPGDFETFGEMLLGAALRSDAVFVVDQIVIGDDSRSLLLDQCASSSLSGARTTP